MDQKNKILVVEDDRDTLFLLEKLLTRSGYEVIKSKNGEEALKILPELNPKVLIADWTMPVVDGLELCKKMKDDPDYKMIYFIMLTARASINDRVTGLDIGADDFIVKPIENQELLARIRTGIRIYNLQAELKSIEHNKAIIEMACTIGHKINNPLSSLIMSLRNVKDEIENVKLNSANDDFDVINKSIERIKVLVKDLTHLQNPEVIEYSSGSKMIKLTD